MINPVLDSLRPVIKNSKYVKINLEKIPEVCAKFDAHKTDYWMDESPYSLAHLDDKAKLNFIFVFNSLNFCYWGNPKWAIEYNGKQYDGAWGMIASLGRALAAGVPILNANYLLSLTTEKLAEIFKGNVGIPLFTERLEILRENGRILAEKYGGQFFNVVEKAGYDALALLEILTTDFPSFNDYAEYAGHKIIFHKRAQLVVADVFRDFHGQGYGALTRIDQLTASADYKLPQILRKLGILEYAPDLAAKVDNRILISAGSQEEVEIRANMVWAVELMKGQLLKINPQIRSIDIDSYLWLLGVNSGKLSTDKPYHLTRTIFY